MHCRCFTGHLVWILLFATLYLVFFHGSEKGQPKRSITVINKSALGGKVICLRWIINKKNSTEPLTNVCTEKASVIYM